MAVPPWLKTPDDVNALVPALWPANVRRGADGVLRVAGLRADDIARQYGTPVYVLDEADMRSRAAAFRDAFRAAFAPSDRGPSDRGPSDRGPSDRGPSDRGPSDRGPSDRGPSDLAPAADHAGAGTGAEQIDVYYAGKAFLSKAIARIVSSEGLCLDVCSGGELAVALAAGVPPERIGLHGSNKSAAELAKAVGCGVGRIIVDSFHEIERLRDIARARGVRPRVLLRLTVGVQAHTHEYIATAHEDQKFGFSLAGGDAAVAVAKILGEGTLELRGFHSHIGSQIFDGAGFEMAARRLIGLMATVRAEHGVTLPELDLGGGFGIAYTTQDTPASPQELADGLARVVRAECAAAGMPVPHLSIEPGRAIIGPSVFTLYEVGTVKEVAATRTYVSVDGGMSDNIRSALYGAAYSATIASRASTAPPMLARVVGKHCESGDVLVKDEFLPADTRPGDLLAVPGAGAYARSMASNYNHVPRPPVVAVAGGVARLIVRRETDDDLLALDVG